MSDARKISIAIVGVTPIMFDRYAGDNKEILPVEQKMYVEEGKIVLPAANISSFLSAELTESAPKRTLGKGWQKVAKAALSYLMIEPDNPAFLRDGKPIACHPSNYLIDTRVARMKKGQLVIPNPKVRPVLPKPWSLEFSVVLFPNPDLTENILKRLFTEGGYAIGFGTYRGAYGKFRVDRWESSKWDGAE